MVTSSAGTGVTSMPKGDKGLAAMGDRGPILRGVMMQAVFIGVLLQLLVGVFKPLLMPDMPENLRWSNRKGSGASKGVSASLALLGVLAIELLRQSIFGRGGAQAEPKSESLEHRTNSFLDGAPGHTARRHEVAASVGVRSEARPLSQACSL